MKRKLAGLIAVFVVAVSILAISQVMAQGRGDGPIVFVESQGLYYDSIVVRDPLPPNGPFQLLEMVNGDLVTEFGPGDTGYYGGRWVEDFDGDGEMHYFLCPLLGPGREEP